MTDRLRAYLQAQLEDPAPTPDDDAVTPTGRAPYPPRYRPRDEAPVPDPEPAASHTPTIAEVLRARIEAAPGFLPKTRPLPADAPADETGPRMTSLADLLQAGQEERRQFEREHRERRR